MTRGRLCVCWDHCPAPWLTLPTDFHPHRKSHIEVLWNTEQLFTPCMVVPSTVRSLCIFRALTSLGVILTQKHFLNFEKSYFRWMTLTIADLVQKVTLQELGMTSLEQGIMCFTVANDCESSKCWQHIVSGTVMMAKGINVLKKNLTSFSMFYPRVGVTGDGSEAQMQSISMPCTYPFWFLALWQGALKLHARHCFGGPFLLEMQLSFLLTKTFVMIP